MDSEIRLIGICDPHFSASNPAAWKASYLDHLEKTITQVFRYAKKREAHGILWAGDWFQYKAPARNPIWFVTRVIRFLQQAGVRHYGILGNHDVKYNDWTIGLQGQAAQLMLVADAFHLLDQNPATFEGDGFSVQLSGASFRQGLATDCRDLKRAEGVTHHVALGHFWFGRKTGEFWGEPMYGPDFFAKSDPDVYLIGHHHEDQGIQRVGGKHYCAAGSITRVGAYKSDLNRAPSAIEMIFTRDSFDTKVLRPKVPAPEDVMDLRVRAQVAEEREEMESFLSNLSDSKITTTDPVEILAELDADQKVLSKAKEYLDAAGEVLEG